MGRAQKQYNVGYAPEGNFLQYTGPAESRQYSSTGKHIRFITVQCTAGYPGCMGQCEVEHSSWSCGGTTRCRTCGHGAKADKIRITYAHGFRPVGSSLIYLGEAGVQGSQRLVSLLCDCGNETIMQCGNWLNIQRCHDCALQATVSTKTIKYPIGFRPESSLLTYTGKKRQGHFVECTCLCGTEVLVEQNNWINLSTISCRACGTVRAAEKNRKPVEEMSLLAKFPRMSLELVEDDPAKIRYYDQTVRSWRCLGNPEHTWTGSCASRTSRNNGCPFCADYGFSRRKWSMLYLVSAPTHHVYGVTNILDVKQDRMSRPLSYGLPVLSLYEGSGEAVWSAEREIQATLEHYALAVGDGQVNESILLGQVPRLHVIALKHGLVPVWY